MWQRGPASQPTAHKQLLNQLRHSCSQKPALMLSLVFFFGIIHVTVVSDERQGNWRET